MILNVAFVKLNNNNFGKFNAELIFNFDSATNGWSYKWHHWASWSPAEIAWSEEHPWFT